MHDFLAHAGLVDLGEEVGEDEGTDPGPTRNDSVILVIAASGSILMTWLGSAKVMIHVNEDVADPAGVRVPDRRPSRAVAQLRSKRFSRERRARDRGARSVGGTSITTRPLSVRLAPA